MITPPTIEPTTSKPRHSGTGALVAVGTFWLIVQTLATKGITFSRQLLLAWLLSSEDFGKISMAYTVTTLVALLINPGIDVILVRRGRRFDLWSTPAFYFGLTTGLLGCIAILAMAPVAAWIYGEPQLVGLLTVLAFGTPLGTVLLVPTAKLRSSMSFRTLAATNFLQTALQAALTVAFAATGFGAYSFVLPVPIVYLVQAVVLWLIAKPVIRRRSPFRHWRYLIGDSSYIFGTRLLHALVSQGDYAILGALYGAVVVGPYFFAYQIATQAIRLTAGSLQLVLMAGLARMPSFSDKQTQATLRASKALALVGVPLCMLQATVADVTLLALYGEKWAAAIPYVQLISLGLAFDVVSWPAGSLLQARGEFKRSLLLASAFVPIFIVAITVGVWFGQALGVAIAVCCYYMFCSPMLVLWVFRSSNVAWNDLVDLYVRPVSIGVLTAGAARVAIHLSAGVHPLLQCVVAVLVGLAAMALSARVLMSSSWNEITLRLHHIVASVAPLRR